MDPRLRDDNKGCSGTEVTTYFRNAWRRSVVGQRLLAAERRVYEKILLAHYLRLDSWDGRKHRQTLDRCLSWLLAPDDIRTVAYLQYEYLRGRDDDFVAFLREVLDVTDDSAAKEALLQSHGARAARALSAARARGSY